MKRGKSITVLRKKLDEIFTAHHFSEDISEEDETEYIEILSQMIREVLPSKLYRYRSCTKYGIKGFKDDIVAAVSPNDFNDPYDCLIGQSLNFEDRTDIPSFPEILEYYKKYKKLPEIFNYYMNDKLNKHFMKALDGLIAGEWTYDEDESGNTSILDEQIDKCSRFLMDVSRVACFSEQINSILMWSHYASNHTGFALGYDFTDEYNTHALNSLFPVIYSNKRYDASEALRYLVAYSAGMKHNKLNDAFFHIAVVLYKSLEWKYEKEWRIVTYNCKDKLDMINLRPNSIYYGCRIDLKNYEKLHKIAVKKGLKEYKVAIDNNSLSYKMKIISC